MAWMVVVTSSSAISTPLTVAATPPVNPDADPLDKHPAAVHKHAAVKPATQAAFMMRAVLITSFPTECTTRKTRGIVLCCGYFLTRIKLPLEPHKKPTSVSHTSPHSSSGIQTKNAPTVFVDAFHRAQYVRCRYFFAAFLRSVAESKRLRKRMLSGVTSTSSSSSMYSRASSSVNVIGGVS